MILDNRDIYDRYLKVFEEKFGNMEFGEPVRVEGHLVKKMRLEEFVDAWAEYKKIEDFLRDTMSRGNTLSDAVERQYQELCAKVLERPKDFKLL